MSVVKRGRRCKLAGIIGLLAMVLLMPGASAGADGEAGTSATAKKCGSVVKKIFALNEGVPFYKAKVLVASGNVPCSEARRIIWKALKPGGFNARIQDWVCRSKGLYDPFIEKCERSSGAGREVIKSSKPKRCRSCQRNVKMLPLMGEVSPSELKGETSRWRRCGRVHWVGKQFLRVEGRNLICRRAMNVSRSLIGKIRRGRCENAVLCSAKGFTCPVVRGRSAWYCHREQERVRLKAIRS